MKTLLELAQSETDESVKWNPFNEVVQSRKDGEQYISVTKAEGYANRRLTLGEFIKNFSHNNIIRLHYKIKGGHQCVLETENDVSMDWQVNKAQGKNRHYIDNKVLGVVGIYGYKENPDAINIVIERLENQPFVEEITEEVINQESV